MSGSANALVMKEINTNLVRRTLKQRREATKLQIAQATGLSTVTVATVLLGLLEVGVAFDAGTVASQGGRPAQLFRFNENHAHVLVLFAHEQDGVDLLRLRVANLYGEPVRALEAPLEDVRLRTFEPFIERALRESPTIGAIGFGLPGVEWGGEILAADYPGLTGAPFVEHYRGRFGLPVVVHNDVNAAAAGYCRRHGIGGEAATVYLYFPQKYPPGGGIFLNGRLYTGAGNFAGEVAGMPLGIDWRDATLYGSVTRASEAIATLVGAISHLLNPQSVILSGRFLSEGHVREIERLCAARQPAHSIPALRLAADFALDYQTGMVDETLALLEPPAPIAL